MSVLSRSAQGHQESVGPTMSEGSPDTSAPGMSRRRYWLWTVLLSAVVALYRRWTIGRGWFSADDFVHMTRVTDRPLGEVLPEFNASGHISNLTGSLEWYLQRVAPYDWTTRVWLVVACVFVAQLAWSGVAARLVGRSPLSLLMVTGVGFSTLALTALQWWAQSAATAPLQVLAALAVLCMVVAVTGGSRLCGWAAVVIVALGLVGSERFVLTAGLVLVTPFLVGLAGGVRTALRLTRERWPVLVAVLVTTLGYLVYYLGASRNASAPANYRLGDALLGLRQVLFPLLWGGPGSISEGAVTAAGNAPGWLTDLSLLAVIVVGGLLLLRAPRSLIPWALLVAVWMVWSVVLVSQRGLPSILSDWRVYGDLYPWLVMALISSCAALLAARPRQASGMRFAGIGLGLGLAIVVQLHLVTTVNATRYWWANPAQGFADTALQELNLRPWGSLLDEPLPAEVVRGGLITEERRPSIVFGGSPMRPTLDRPTDFPFVLDASGRPHLAVVEGGTQSLSGPSPGCGWPAKDGTLRVPLEGPLYSWNWLMRIGYLSGAERVGIVTTGGIRTELALHKGLGEVFLPWRGPVGSAVVVTVEGGTGFCVDSIEVGNIGVGELAPEAVESR